MTLQSSGAISMNDINIELGRASGSSINLNEAAVRALAGVPSGTIRLSDFYGKSSFTIGFDNAFSRFAGGSSPSSMGVSFTLNTNATVSVSGGSGTTATRWGTPTTAGIGSQYEALIQVTSIYIEGVGVSDYVKFAGVNLTATGNSGWFALSTNITLDVRAETGDGDGGFTTVDGRVYVRQISNPSNIANTTFSMTANADL